MEARPVPPARFTHLEEYNRRTARHLQHNERCLQLTVPDASNLSKLVPSAEHMEFIESTRSLIRTDRVFDEPGMPQLTRHWRDLSRDSSFGAQIFPAHHATLLQALQAKLLTMLAGRVGLGAQHIHGRLRLGRDQQLRERL